MPETSLPPNPSRRKFLRIAAAGAGAVTLTCCGLSLAATQSAPKTPAAPIDTPSYVFGKEIRMTQPILVAYATRTGSTTGVAGAIGETLAARGFRVDVRPMQSRPSVKDYQAVILGSAINGYNWLPEAVEYVQANQRDLSQLPVALFCVHALNLSDKERSRKARSSYLKVIRPLVNPLAEGFFAGMCAKPEDTGFLLRWFAKTFMDSGEGDCRDWNKIRAWGQALPV